ncbi:hypothetical protein ABIE44_003565 [Marmoricola sp. OAE513]|uniref:hypothetical protein n=1 Tax=Marmoricola sp. OAE513 TaxID=2817894 RepID=UPI001AE4B866
MTKILGWVAAGLLVSGLILGFLPLNSYEIDCGSVFNPTSKSERAKDAADQRDEEDISYPDFCDEARDGAVRTPIILLVMGVAVAGAAVHSSGVSLVRKGGWSGTELRED